MGDRDLVPKGKLAIADAGSGIRVADAVEKARQSGRRWLLMTAAGAGPDDVLLYDVHKARPALKSLSGSFVPNDIPSSPKVAFVQAAPGVEEAARRKPLVGPGWPIFKENYLKYLGMDRSDVAILSVVPLYLTDDSGRTRPPYGSEVGEWKPYLRKQVEDLGDIPVIALGSTAARALGERCDDFCPHPNVFRHKPASREPSYKMTRLAKALTNWQDCARMAKEDQDPSANTPGAEGSDGATLKILKSDTSQGIVYGVVLEPDTVDHQLDFTNPAEIEKAAHGYMRKKDRYIGFRHQRKANATILESQIVRAPFPMGGTVVKEGSWFMVVQANDPADKEAIASGKLNAFSIGGRGKRTPIKLQA